MTISRTTHPLLQGEMTHIQSWREWRELWDKNPCVEMRHSLLHFGLRVPLGIHCGEETGWTRVNELYSERVLFYLMLADGWCGDTSQFSCEPQRPHYLNDSGFETGLGVLKGDGTLRQRLAQKAFAVLFGSLVPRSGGKRDEGERRVGLNHYDYNGKLERLYVHHMSSEETIALLRFFRPCWGRWERDHLSNLLNRNLGGKFPRHGDVADHLVEKVWKFLADWLVSLWDIKMPEEQMFYTKSQNPTEEFLRAEAQDSFKRKLEFHGLLKRHHFLFAVMLVCLGEGKRLRKMQMDERTLRLLQRFAMAARVPSETYDEERGCLGREERRPQSLEEAMNFGESPMRRGVAEFLLFHRTRKKAQLEHATVARSHEKRYKAELARQARARRAEKVRLLKEEMKALQ